MGEKNAQVSVAAASKKHERPAAQALPAGPDYWPVPVQERRHPSPGKPQSSRRTARSHA